MKLLAVATLLSAILLAQISISVTTAMDYITIQRGEEKLALSGEVVVDAQNGDVMLRSVDGRLWLIPAAEIVERTSDDKPFQGLSDEDAEKSLLTEFPDRFKIYRTAHYVICYNTSEAYAKWVGALYERLYSAFMNYWERRDFDMHAADTPLVVLIFDSKENYARHALKELGSDPGGMIAYYHMETNRVTMYDITGADAINKQNGQRTAAQINTILSQPNTAAMVATVVHEATHQLAFNGGLQTRYADWPFWVSEGLAMYFETPSLGSSRGWTGLGKVNRVRLVQMRKYIATRGDNSLLTLISDDKRFRDPEVMLDTYAEAWAFNYFLIHKYSDEYFDYLHSLAKKKPLLEDTPEQRLEEFKQFFGEDLDDLDRKFTAYIRTLK